MNRTDCDVLIMGGGLAGLAAAAALAPHGLRVTIVESRQRLGGRAGSFTDASSGQLVDACQHVSMGCCTQFAHFCKTVGIDHYLQPQPTLYFMTPDRRVSRFAADPLPAPFHFTRALWNAHYLTFTDKIRIGWGMLQMLRADPEADPPLLPWLKRHRQNRRTIERFWGVVLVSALNEQLDRLGLKYARKVFRDAFVMDRHGFEVHIPTVPLGRLYGEELRSWFDRQGVKIETNASVRSLDHEGDRVSGVQLRDGRSLQARSYLSALPFDRLLAVMPTTWRESIPAFARLQQLEVSPITSVHFWFDRPIIDLPHVVLLDSVGQWVFNRGEVAPGEFYVQVVISAAHNLAEMGRERVQERIAKELERLFPPVAQATLLRARVVTEHSATFAPLPGVDRYRPAQTTPISNFFLAGDWTTTGWPATMEGAVRSGYLAASAIQQALTNAKILSVRSSVNELIAR